MLTKPKIIIFDMDGVVTSEKYYWWTAELTIAEIFFSLSSKKIPTKDIKEFLSEISFLSLKNIRLIKSLGLTTNWDLTAVVASIFLIHFINISKNKDKIASLLESADLLSVDFFNELGNYLKINDLSVVEQNKIVADFTNFHGINNELSKTALDFYKSMEDKVNIVLGRGGKFFKHEGIFWQYCKEIFQKWRIPHTLELEKPLLETNKLVELLKYLRKKGLILGIATGRPKQELEPLLKEWGIFDFFDKKRIITDDFAVEAKREFPEMNFSKPEPYLLLKSRYPDSKTSTLINNTFKEEKDVWMIGDTVGDVVSAKKAGFTSIVVFSGALNSTYKKVFIKSGADFFLDNVLEIYSLF